MSEPTDTPPTDEQSPEVLQDAPFLGWPPEPIRPDRFEPVFDGPTSQTVMSRSRRYWRKMSELGRASSRFDVSPLDLRALLCRIPALPNYIPREARSIAGSAHWSNTATNCDAKTRVTPRTISLRGTHPVVCRISSLETFQKWNRDTHNGLALLIIGWAYVFGANLAERQGLSINYAPQEETSRDGAGQGGNHMLDLRYATMEERRWWKAVLANGRGWKVEGGVVLPWTISIENIGVDVPDVAVRMTDMPPSSWQAASYIGRLSLAYGLWGQLTASLAAALCIPLQYTIMSHWAPEIDLPKPSLGVPRFHPRGDPCLLKELKLIDYYMTLSLDPSTIGCAMWSSFWTEGVPCNSAGAWFGPIADVLRPHLEANEHKTVVKILSKASPRAEPLWLGSALLGPSSLIGRIETYLDRGRFVPCTGPDPTAAVWTGLPHSFLDGYCTRGITHKYTVSRADVWRLRRENAHQYKTRDFEQPLPHSWPPFGRMREEDVELEIREHLTCNHRWKYLFWTWAGELEDVGFSHCGRLLRPLNIMMGQLDFGGDGWSQYGALNVTNQGLNHIEASDNLTSAMFSWARSQVESGFFETVVPIRPLIGMRLVRRHNRPKTGEPHDPIIRENVAKWVRQVGASAKLARGEPLLSEDESTDESDPECNGYEEEEEENYEGKGKGKAL
ncbi:unnamed protein product [Clonostachys byssicola]|uniref:Uncharacterized protein n=1 Tax=Clonostachys byssicola TaxID=160290 RepID=A0A9N9UET5_9HYPO|nr:unnamed protein product [Clonostachys byssicola]